LILVREPVSYRIIKKLDIETPIILTFDTTWLFDSTVNLEFDHAPSICVGVSPGIYSHVFSKREIERHVLSYAKALDEAVEKFGFSIVFLPHYVSGFQYDDLAISKMIMQRMKNKEHVSIAKVENAEEFKSFSNRMDLVVSSRLHPTIFAFSGRLPAVCIAYDHKQIGLFESLDMIKCVIPFHELSAKRLLSTICYVWDNRKKIEAMLDANVPSIRKSIKKAIGFALSQILEESRASVECSE